MLLVKTRVGPSLIEGTGLFAAEDIPKGTVTWRFMAGYDRTFLPSAIDALPAVARDEILRYAYVNEQTGHYVFCLDNARFMNHSDDPNTVGVHAAGAIEGYDVALRDITSGEELTCDYRTFDRSFEQKLGG